MKNYNIRLGTAPDSWGVWFPDDDKQPDCMRCLDEIALSGFTGVELGPWGYLPNDINTLKKALELRGLVLVAGTAGADFSSGASVAKLCAVIDEMAPLLAGFPEAKYVVLLPDMYTDAATGEETLPRVLDGGALAVMHANIEKICVYVRKLGLVPALHPHVDSHIQTEEEIERVLDNTSAELCFDTGHHLYGGGDPVAFYKKHFKRIPFMHVKECDMRIKSKMEACGWPFSKAVSEGIMCEPGTGGINFTDLFGHMKQIGYNGWVVAEQDMYPLEDFNKPLATAKRTFNYLRGLVG
ncbi:MAG: sugar phosphate isomerase/epimerase [Defluviitaleaceae bacterium]|nr:sugar phosphate isomerase/epimerase [Defluviitaleaceae bacterium]